MAENTNSGILKLVLILYALICLIYGLGFFLIPDSLVELSGGPPVYHGWLRWSGGVLIALCIGTILVYLKPRGQGIFVTTMAIGTLLAGLALLWAWIKIEEEEVNVWFTALPAVILLIVSILFWWGRKAANAILYPE